MQEAAFTIGTTTKPHLSSTNGRKTRHLLPIGVMPMSCQTLFSQEPPAGTTDMLPFIGWHGHAWF